MKEPFEHTFKTIIDHNIPKRLLLRMLEKERLPNVFLFSGIEGIGKKSTAFSFIKIINCEKDKGSENCSCNICRKIREQKTIDLFQIFPSGATNQISVDEIRDFHDKAGIYPVEFRKKVLFIHGADRLNINAANALLKLLEEPPDHLLIFLFTSNLSSILPTILSRCTLIRFHPIPKSLLVEWLQKETGVTEKDAEVAAFFSEGSIVKAIQSVSGDMLKKRTDICDLLENYLKNGFHSIPAAAFNIRNSVNNSEEFFQIALMWFRDILLLNFHGTDKSGEEISSSIMNIDKLDGLNSFKMKLTPAKVYNIINTILTTQEYSNRIVNEDLLLRVILTEINKIING